MHTTLGFPTRYLPNRFKSLTSASFGAFIFLVSDFTVSAMSARSCARNCALITRLLYSVVCSAVTGGRPTDASTSLLFFFSDGVTTLFAFSKFNCLMIISACLGSASYVTFPVSWS